MVLATPIPQLELALQGKIEFVRLSNPFGSGKKKRRGETLKDTPLDARDRAPTRTERADVASQLKAVFGSMSGRKGGLRPAAKGRPSKRI